MYDSFLTNEVQINCDRDVVISLYCVHLVADELETWIGENQNCIKFQIQSVNVELLFQAYIFAPNPFEEREKRMEEN